jgi:hypothetical protein
MTRPFTGTPAQTISDGVKLLYEWVSYDTGPIPRQMMDALYGPQAGVFGNTAATADNVRYGFKTNGRTMVLLLNGAYNQRQCNAIYEGWRSDVAPEPTETFMINTFWRQAGLIKDKLFDSGLGRTESLNIFGYSAGGCIGEALILRLKRQGYDGAMQICTFGSPKSMSPAAGLEMRNAAYSKYRVFMEDDPLAKMPIRTTEDRTIALIIGALYVNKWNSWQHGILGYQRSVSGVWSAQDIPQNVTAPTPIDLAAWYLGLNRDVSGVHSLRRYHQFCTLPSDVLPPPIPAPVPVPTPAPVPGAIIRREIREVEAEVLARARAVAQQGIRVPSTRRVTWRRVGRLYHVRWEGRTISITRSRRHAISLARRLNLSLASLLSSGIVSFDGFTEAMEAFVQQVVNGVSEEEVFVDQGILP